MTKSEDQTSESLWGEGTSVFDVFVKMHPELNLKPGRWAFHNFLRNHRVDLLKVDAIRKAKNRFWIAHRVRFLKAAFALSTGCGVSMRELDCASPTMETQWTDTGQVMRRMAATPIEGGIATGDHRATEWPESESDALIAARIIGQDRQHIRELADWLHTWRCALRAN